MKPTRDQAIVFFKKHPFNAKPRFKVRLKIKSEDKDLASEDRIQLVTLLTEPADCYLNGKHLGTASAGLNTASIPLERAPCRCDVCHGKAIIEFKKRRSHINRFTATH